MPPLPPESYALQSDLVALQGVVTVLTARIMALEASVIEVEKKRKWMMDHLQSRTGGYSVIPPEPTSYP
jgi:hypothetical protein